jgi:endonuclease-8
MPEGPEIRQEADRIALVLEGQRINRVTITPEHLRAYESTLEGKEVTRVYTRGKAMLVEFECDLTLYSHNQLYGRWMTRKSSKLPETRRQLRLALYTDRGIACLYSASEVAILSDNELAMHPFLAKLGPDVLDAALTTQEITTRLLSKTFANRRLGNLYLDQTYLAGIGNYLRSEILFDAGLHPGRIPRLLTKSELETLADSTLRICHRAYREKGVVNDPTRVAELRARGATRSKLRFAVFARNQQPCYRCGDSIERITVTSRRLYLCPSCQRVPQAPR